MTLTAIWMTPAVTAYRRLRAEDPAAATAVGNAIRKLAEDPRPSTSRQLGTSNFHRLRIDTYRVVYEIDEPASTLLVLTIGRAPN